jgi:hypothetical protein
MSLDTELVNMREEGLESHDISIFVEERTEHIHSKISLRTVIAAIDHANKMTRLFGDRANTSLGKILNRKIQNRADRTGKRIAKAVNKSNMKNYRTKRAIEFVGNLISKLFGNPGPEEWKQNKRNVLAMKEAIERQMSNSAILHHDIDENRNLINTQNEIIRQTVKSVTSNENRLNKVDNELNELETFIELETLYDSIDEILLALVDIESDARFGRCNEKGLDPDFLIDHLRELESNKNSIAPVFASWEWQNYYTSELCSIALHMDELWITMRIPIVNIAEQFTRAVPLSDQLWIKEKTSKLGLDATLFKQKQLEVYMVVTRPNLDTCSTLGTTRVCNVRKTKFRSASPCLVPIDINHNRVLILSNSTNSASEVKSICGSRIKSMNVNSTAVVRTPDECSLLSRTFEVGKIVAIRNISTFGNIGRVEPIVIHLKSEKVKASSANQSLLSDIPLNETKFLENADEAKRNLDNVHFDQTWSHGSWWITASSSTTIVLVLIIAFILVMKLRSNCKDKSNERVEVHINNERDKDKNCCINIDSCEQKTEDDCPDCTERPSDDPEQPLDSKKGDLPKRPMCQFKR